MKTPHINFDEFIFSESFIRLISEVIARDFGLMTAMLNSANETSNWFTILENALLANEFVVFEETLRLDDSSAIYNPKITEAVATIKFFYSYYQQMVSISPICKKPEFMGGIIEKMIQEKDCSNCEMMGEVLKQYLQLQDTSDPEKFQEYLKTLIIGLIRKTAEQFRYLLLKSRETLLKKEKLPEPI